MQGYLNVLSEENEAGIISVSSETRGCSVNNILNSNEKRLWLSDKGLPQQITIDISQLIERPKIITCFGWFCWHSYKSNPSVIEIWLSTDNASYHKWATCSASCKSGSNFYEIDPIHESINYFKLVITATHGAPSTYINQIFLYEAFYADLESKSIQDTNKSFENIRSFEYSSVEELRKSPDYIQIDQKPQKIEEPNEFIYEYRDNQVESISKPIGSSGNHILPRIDEVGRLKKEVANWAEDIHAIQGALSELIAQVDKLQSTSSANKPANLLNAFKNEILQSVKTDLGSNTERSDRDQYHSIEDVFNKHIKAWESQVLGPDLIKISRQPVNAQEILKKLEEKLKYKAKLLKKKRILQLLAR